MYFLFAYEYYYPSGGVHDLVGIYDSLSEAKEAYKKNPPKDGVAEIYVFYMGSFRLVSEWTGTPWRDIKLEE